ncbi:MAG: transcription termination/antitermination protein NusA [Clostridiales bacterium]|nr:transcription termination/antitermination protein NusA [Clostridiales bacterium]
MATKNVKNEIEDLSSAIDSILRDRRLDKNMLLNAIEAALISAYKKNFGRNAEVRVTFDGRDVEITAQKNVVEEVVDPQTEISLEEAREIDARYGLGDLLPVVVNPRNFGRIAAQTAKQVIVQHLREAERGGIYEEYIEKENEVLTAIIHSVENDGNIFVEIGRTDGVLEAAQRMPGEELKPNDRVKVYVLNVSRSNRGPQITVSRTHPGLVKRLFELEVPEIRSGSVQIRAIAREAGYRTKMAVHSNDPMIDAVGSCVGPRGLRVENVVNELKTEKIDIIKWSNDPAEYISNALNPARVLNVFVAEHEKSARVIVPDNQLSLAIGKEGQNARLAAKLTGWKIDIKSQSQAEAAKAAEMEEKPAVADEEDAELEI